MAFLKKCTQEIEFFTKVSRDYSPESYEECLKYMYHHGFARGQVVFDVGKPILVLCD